jgi:hypothetical protein
MAMARVIDRRVTVEMEGDFVVFLNGRATAAGRASVREEAYPQGALTEGIDV